MILHARLFSSYIVAIRLLWLLYGHWRHLTSSQFVLARMRAMACAADREVLLDRLDEELRMTSQPTPQLFAKVIDVVCTRLAVLSKSGKTLGIGLLIESGAWTDSALGLVDLELPLWKIRRVAYESGEWFCSLSRTPNLPVEFDDAVDASHAVLALAILRALVEARRVTNAEHQFLPNRTSHAWRSTAPQISSPADLICCDNFA